MLRLLSDQNLDRRILRDVRRQLPGVDVVFPLDVGMAQAADLDLLDWAARERRVLVTHDARTMPDFAYERIAAGLPMAGVIVIQSNVSMRQAIDDLLLILNCCQDDELSGQVYRIPI